MTDLEDRTVPLSTQFFYDLLVASPVYLQGPVAVRAAQAVFTALQEHRRYMQAAVDRSPFTEEEIQKLLVEHADAYGYKNHERSVARAEHARKRMKVKEVRASKLKAELTALKMRDLMRDTNEQSTHSLDEFDNTIADFCRARIPERIFE